MKYKSVVATKRGGPDVLRIMENELRAPLKDEVRIRIQATGVGRTDISYRHGDSPLSPRVPFIPGYEMAGVIDAVGENVVNLNIGTPVAALTETGAYAEMIYLPQGRVVPIPAGLDPAEVAIVALNYVTAYQMLTRVAKVKESDKILVLGASGGVGTALIELGRIMKLKTYGTASAEKHGLITSLGAIPIDYQTGNVLEKISRMEPEGINYVFDGIGEKGSEQYLKILKNGGKLVRFAAPVGNFLNLIQFFMRIMWINILPGGKKMEFYGISALYRRDKKPYKDDLSILLKMLGDGIIKPVISIRLPLLEAARGNEILESGRVLGNIVLVSPELT